MFSDGSSFYVPCVWSHCRQTNQNYLTVSLTRPVSCVPDKFFFLLLLFLINLLELLSFGELYLFDDEYDNDGSGSGSPGTCDFPFCSGKSVGPVNRCTKLSKCNIPGFNETLLVFVLQNSDPLLEITNKSTIQHNLCSEY